MATWQKILYLILMLGLCWMVYQNIRRNPEWLSKKSISKSAMVMGVLALGLIGFIGLCVLLLRSSG